jgi:glyoxylase-like metal-dependent hydrolase (beta-lactamase superfamily II)
MPEFLCVTCGTQFPESAQAPAQCPICEDERQFVGYGGQQWTTLDQLRRNHRNEFAAQEPGLTSIETKPEFAVGERAFLLEAAGGNILWDCLSLIDDSTIAWIKQRGGLTAIAISHPHYYTTMVEWSRAFGGVPIYLHADDRQWVMRPDPAIQFWQGERLAPVEGVALVRGGGHFAGGTMLHWPAGADSRGALLSGDIIQVTPDRRFVSFMYSYVNYVPLSAAIVRRVAQTVAPLAFDRIYGAFAHRTVIGDAKQVIARSVERYCNAIGYNTDPEVS